MADGGTTVGVAPGLFIAATVVVFMTKEDDGISVVVVVEVLALLWHKTWCELWHSGVTSCGIIATHVVAQVVVQVVEQIVA